MQVKSTELVYHEHKVMNFLKTKIWISLLSFTHGPQTTWKALFNYILLNLETGCIPKTQKVSSEMENNTYSEEMQCHILGGCENSVKIQEHISREP